MSEGRVREVREDDRDAWRELFRSYGVFYETRFDDAVLDRVWGWFFDDAHESDALVVVSGDGTPFGLAQYRRAADTFTGGPGWYLDDLFVDPTRRGSGAGAALIEAVTARAAARGGGTLRWITAADNATAQRLYDRVATRAGWVTYEREVAPG